MKFLQSLKKWLLIACSVIFISCSGGGEGGTGMTASPNVSMGTITQFGSIFVNGVEFDTTNTDINIENIAGTDADLRLGMYVTVNGTINPDGLTGVADSVSVREIIRGPVASKTGTNTLTILNQTVHIPSTARFDNILGYSDIKVNDVVEVSGYVKSSGIIYATRIELISSPGPDYKLFGFVENLNTAAQTFTFGGLTISYSGASFSGISRSTLSNNQYIEVTGTYNAASSLLTASRVEKESINTSSTTEVEIEGFITSVTSPTEFTINNLPVTVDPSTVFEGGTQDEIVVGMLIEVEGNFSSGTLLATEVNFEDNIRIEATVNTIDIPTNTMTLVDMNGFSIQTNSFTEFSSDLPAGLNSLQPGIDSIRIRGYLVESTSTVIARRIDYLVPTPNITLQGDVFNLPSEPMLDILGVVIDTSLFAPDAFSVDGSVVTSNEFFGTISTGSIVRADGTISGNTITWTSVEALGD